MARVSVGRAFVVVGALVLAVVQAPVASARVTVPAADQPQPVVQALASEPESEPTAQAPVPKPDADASAPVEVVEDRTATSTSWRQADGSLEVRQSAVPVNFQDETGSWQPIDSTLQPVAGEPSTFESQANSWKTAFGPSGGSGCGQTLQLTGATVVLVPVAAEQVEPTVDGPTATCAGLWPDTDVVETVGAAGVSEDIVVHTSAAPHTFSFNVSGATPVPNADGSVALVADGATVATVPAPTVAIHQGTFDADEAAAVMSVDGEVITIGVSQAWLGSLPDAAFPVVIDPPLQILPTPTVIKSVSDTGGVVPDLSGVVQAGTDSAGLTWRSMVKVTRPSLPATTTSWKLAKVSYYQVCHSGSCTTQGTSGSLYGIVEWDPDDPPGYDDVNHYGNQLLGPQASRAFTGDITSWWGQRYSAWFVTALDGGASLATYDTPTVAFSYFEVPAPTSVIEPANGSVVATTTPTLRAQVMSNQQTAQGDQYRFTLSTSSDFTGSVIDSGWVNGPTWTPPAGALSDGATYYVKVVASPTPNAAATDAYYVAPSAPREITQLTVKRRLGAGGPSPTDTVGTAPGSTTTPSQGSPSPGDSTATETVNLVTGNLALAINTHQTKALGGQAGLALSYNSLESSTSVGTNFGLLASYYHDSSGTHNLSGAPAGRRIDPQVNLAGGEGDFLPVNSLPPGTSGYAVRWTGAITLPAGNWTLGGLTSGGMRVYLDGGTTPVYDNWNAAASTGSATFGTSVAGGRQVSIRVEAWVSPARSRYPVISLWAQSASNSTNTFVVPVSWLVPQSTGLPAGWQMLANPASVQWVRAVDLADEVVVQAASGDTETFTRTSSGVFAAPAGVTDSLVVNGAGRLLLTTGVSTQYEFNGDGTLASMTTVADDRTPTALQYTYTGNPAVLAAITDPVSGRAVTLSYGGSSVCPKTNVAPGGLLCSVTAWDGLVTGFGYSSSGQLIEVDGPGGATTLFGYDPDNKLTAIRDSLAFDYIHSGRTDVPAACKTSSTACPLDTAVTYNAAGQVATVTQPSPTVGAPRPQRTYRYGPGSGQVLVAGQGTGVQYTAAVEYDDHSRLTSKKSWGQAAELAVWDASDRSIASTTTSGLQTSTVRDLAGRVTDTYGPAPTACFALGGWPAGASEPPDPVGGYLPVANPAGTAGCGIARVPHKHTGYDENLHGLAGAYYANTGLAGAATRHAMVTTSSDRTRCPDAAGFCLSWPSGPPSGVGTDSGGGWSMRAEGLMTLPAAQTGQAYTLCSSGPSTVTVDGARVAAIGPASDPNFTAGVSHCATFTLTLPAGTHLLAVTYVGTGSGRNDVAIAETLPTGSVSLPTSWLSPNYGLATSTVDADGKKTTTSYTSADGAIGPQYGIPTAVTVDPDGLALTTTTTYEAPGAGFLRRTAEILPAGSTTTYSYYGGTSAPLAAVCGVTSSVAQGGQVSTQIDPAPSPGAPAREQQFVYDAAGRVAGQRTGSTSTILTAAWNCTAYDQRDRMTSQIWPGTYQGETVDLRDAFYTYAVDGNPLVSEVYSKGLTGDGYYGVQTTVDFLGRLTTYSPLDGVATAYAYNQAGQVTGTDGLQGHIVNTYLPTGQLSTVSVDNILRAAATYDLSIGRLVAVAYGNGVRADYQYDALGNRNGVTYTNATTGALVTGDKETLSAAGRVVTELQDISGTALTNTNPAGATAPTYTYDGAGRLTSAYLVGGTLATYGYGDSPTAQSCQNPQAGKNTNRTSVTVTNLSTLEATSTGYCYNNDDQLTSTTVDGASTTTYTYDDRGNQTSDGATRLTWDVSNRLTTSKLADGSKFTQYQYDPLDRLAWEYSNGVDIDYVYAGFTDAPAATYDSEDGWVLGRFIQLPGGVTLTLGSGNGDEYSLPDLHGNTSVVTGAAQSSGPAAYDPWGALINTFSTLHNGVGGPGFAAFGSQGRITNQLGIITLGARAYNPVEGRFLSVDPIHGGCANPYVYGRGDPFTQADPTGQFCARDYVGVAIGAASFILGILALTPVPPLLAGILTIASLILGGISFGMDAGGCVRGGGIGADCVGAALGGVGALMGIASGAGAFGLLAAIDSIDAGGLAMGSLMFGGIGTAVDGAVVNRAEGRSSTKC